MPEKTTIYSSPDHPACINPGSKPLAESVKADRELEIIPDPNALIEQLLGMPEKKVSQPAVQKKQIVYHNGLKTWNGIIIFSLAAASLIHKIKKEISNILGF